MKSEKEIGEIVRKLRGNMSLRDFGDKCQISHTTIDNIEKGIDVRTGKPTQVKMITLEKIASACGVPMSIFLDEPSKASQTIKDSELAEFLEELKTRPEMKMLFSVTKGATKADVEKAVNIIKALRESENG